MLARALPIKRKHRARRLVDTLIAPLAALAALAAVFTSQWYASLRERLFDAALTVLVTPPPSRVMVLDIDRETLAQIAPWPWSRERLASLVSAAADGSPAAIAIDILLAGPDERSAAALARRLAEATGSADVARMVPELIEGDAVLAAALAKVPSVLGAALDPENTTTPPPRLPVLSRGRVNLEEIWQGAGAVLPPAVLIEAARGVGLIALPGDPDGTVRRVPLMGAAGSAIMPGLALEALRIADGGGPLLVTGEPLQFATGASKAIVANDAMLRLRPGTSRTWETRSLSAARLLTDTSAGAALRNRVVFIGSSAPEAGGLRPAASGLLAPSVHLAADAADQLLAGLSPRRLAWMGQFEAFVIIVFTIGAAMAGALLRPARGAIVATVCGFAWLGLCALLITSAHLLIDPLAPAVTLFAVFASSALAAAQQTVRREAAIRRRFEQRLPPEVVRRIVSEPELLKLGGEQREVTALFTDVEGFTAMTERSDARAVVAALDRYFDGVSSVVVAHGGMVDKIIGDGLLAIFNAPLDLPDHPEHAVACAKALLAFSSRFCSEPESLALAFGRTRIGIDTGVAIVGDIGGGSKLDYTAHGNAVNAASRLEASNKQLGTDVCISGNTAARLPAGALRPLGTIAIRGRDAEIDVFDFWPEGVGPTERALLMTAASADVAQSTAIELIDAYLHVHRADLPVTRWRERLAAGLSQAT